MMAIAGFGRLIMIFETDTVAYNLASGSSVALFVVAVMTALIMTMFVGVIRFYKNLFTGEGYLSFTLPVTPKQHLWVKSTTAVVCTLITLVVILVSCCVMVKGPLFIELIKASMYVLKNCWEVCGAHTILYVIEIVILFLVALYSTYMQYYSCITIGQLARKNRVVAAIGVYFGYYVISQIISTVFIMSLAIYEHLIPYYEIAEFINYHPNTAIHLFLLSLILICALLGLLFFAINRYIMTKKLNLE